MSLVFLMTSQNCLSIVGRQHSISQVSSLIRTINIQSRVFLINLTPYPNAMKNIVSVNYEWMLVLFFGLMLLLPIGLSYNTSIAKSSTGEIPLYYVSPI